MKRWWNRLNVSLWKRRLSRLICSTVVKKSKLLSGTQSTTVLSSHCISQLVHYDKIWSFLTKNEDFSWCNGIEKGHWLDSGKQLWFFWQWCKSAYISAIFKLKHLIYFLTFSSTLFKQVFIAFCYCRKRLQISLLCDHFCPKIKLLPCPSAWTKLFLSRTKSKLSWTKHFLLRTKNFDRS